MDQDIKTRLRQNADLDEMEHCNPIVIALEREAADHIEALERQLADLRQAPVDYTLDHVDLARTILQFLGYAVDPSREPSADWKVDRLAEMIAKSPIAPVERQAPEWISIGDKKPTAYRDVLITLSTGVVVVGVRVDGPGWDWAETDNPQDSEASVTHWMYFPAAPSAGQAKPDGDPLAGCP